MRMTIEITEDNEHKARLLAAVTDDKNKTKLISRVVAEYFDKITLQQIKSLVK